MHIARHQSSRAALCRRLAPLAAMLVAAMPVAAAPSPASQAVRDLPLVDVPAAATSADAAGAALAQRSVAILITGDGDWAPIDRGIAEAVARGGIPVVGLKVRAYLARGKRTPDAVTRDIERIAREYMARSGRDRFILLGYSRGADYLPFIVNRLAPDLGERLALVGMYGVDRDASFEFHLVDLLFDRHRGSDIPVAPELAQMGARAGLHAFCVYGSDEKDSPCRTGVGGPTIRLVERAGAHHFDKNYAGLGRIALDQLAEPGP